MVNKSYLFLIFIILLSSSILAESFVYKQGETISLTAFCFDENNTLCLPSTSCFINVLYPNSTIAVSNGTMSYVSGRFNYTLFPNQTSAVGTYTSVVNCLSSINGYSSFDFTVTKSGEILQTSGALLYLLSTIFLFILVITSIIVTIKIPYSDKLDERGYITRVSKLKYFKIGMFGVTYGMFMLFLNALVGLANYYLNLGLFYGIISGLFLALMRLVWPITVLLLVLIGIQMIKDVNKMNLIKKFGKIP